MSTQFKLAVQPGRRTTRVYRKEEQVQREVEVTLRGMGYKVWSTVHRYKLQTCPNCQHRFRPKGGYGSTKGVPDILCRGRGWPKAMGLFIELKGEKTALSPEQKLQLEQGDIIVVRSAEQAVAIVQSFERFLERRKFTP